MRPLSDEQVAILTSCRDSGERIVVAARRAGVSSSLASKWCKTTGIPWPRGDYRRDLRGQGRQTASRDKALADLEKMLAGMTRSQSPAMAEFAVHSLAKLRDQRVTTTTPSSGNLAPSGYVVRKSGGRDV